MNRERTDEWVTVSGLKHHLNVWDGGGSTTVLFLHGYLDLGRSWGFSIDALGDNDWHIVAPDWRGHGDTQWIGAGGYYHFTDYVRDLEQIVRHVRRDRLVIVAHSMGAMVATLWCGTRPDEIDGLVLVEGLGPVPVRAEDYPDRMRRWLEQTAPYDSDKRDRPMNNVEHVERRLERAFPRLSKYVLAETARFATKNAADGKLRWKYDPLLTTNAPMPTLPSIAAEFWKRVTCPVLWIGGQESPWVRPEVFQWLDRVNDLTKRILPGVGHMVHNEASADLASELQEFMVQLTN